MKHHQDSMQKLIEKVDWWTKTAHAGIKECAAKVAPEVADHCRDGAKEEHKQNIVFLLEFNHRIFIKVGDRNRARTPARLKDHPFNMGPKEARVCIAMIEVGIGVVVVIAMTTGPPRNRALYCTEPRHMLSLIHI